MNSLLAVLCVKRLLQRQVLSHRATSSSSVKHEEDAVLENHDMIQRRKGICHGSISLSLKDNSRVVRIALQAFNYRHTATRDQVQRMAAFACYEAFQLRIQQLHGCVSYVCNIPFMYKKHLKIRMLECRNSYLVLIWIDCLIRMHDVPGQVCRDVGANIPKTGSKGGKPTCIHWILRTYMYSSGCWCNCMRFDSASSCQNIKL